HSPDPHRPLPFPTRRSSDLRLRRLLSDGEAHALERDLRLVQRHRLEIRDGCGAGPGPDLHADHGALLHLASRGLGLVLDLADERSEEHTSELQSLTNLVCRL